MLKRIYLGLTTINGDEWKNKVKEIDELGLEEISIFPTCLNLEKRKELYGLLEKTKLKSIPHVHIRTEDMENWEMDYLMEKYHTRIFNMHPQENLADFIKEKQKYLKMIYIENLLSIDECFEKTVKSCGGVCLDFSHWERHGFKEKNSGYDKLPDLLNQYKIGVNHLSASKSGSINLSGGSAVESVRDFGDHWLDDLSEVDYVKKYKKYLAEIISIELENPLKRQLEVKEYLEKNLEL